jgi:DNA-binding CsgD family transcriptional regulator
LDEAMKVASGIPGAGFALIEGTANGWALQHPESVLRAIDDFVGWNSGECGPSREGAPRLSRRELEVTRLLVQGKSAREIGADLALAVRTVERHISNVYRKLGARNRAHAVALAIELGLVAETG